jgi:PKD repeat protein
LSEFSSIPCLTLEDKLTHSSIDLHIDSTYSFVSAIDTSVINNRFVLHFGVDAIVPSASLSSSNLSIPGNNTVVFTNTSSGANSYIWNFGDNSPADSSANPSHTYAAAGVYTVTLLASNGAGCSQSTSYVVTVDNVTGIQSNVAEGVANVVKDAQGLILNYNFSKSTRVKINLFNTVGQLVSSPETMVLQSKGGKRIELAELPKGLYTIELLFDSKRTIRKIEF